jgi:hypothetical protein
MTSTEYLEDLWGKLQATYHYAVQLDNPPASLLARSTAHAEELFEIAQHYMQFGSVARIPRADGRSLIVEVCTHDGGRYVKFTSSSQIEI